MDTEWFAITLMTSIVPSANRDPQNPHSQFFETSFQPPIMAGPSCYRNWRECIDMSMSKRIGCLCKIRYAVMNNTVRKHEIFGTQEWWDHERASDFPGLCIYIIVYACNMATWYTNPHSLVEPSVSLFPRQENLELSLRITLRSLCISADTFDNYSASFWQLWGRW